MKVRDSAQERLFSMRNIHPLQSKFIKLIYLSNFVIFLSNPAKIIK